MTIHRIEHAVVMDTDHIPGRGGYALVGVSPGVSPSERAFVAQNFGISDYLHDPQLQKPDEHRIFYSFFRIPGGGYAFVRRFAKGLRRSQTQNRLFVHTLIIDENLFARLGGLPWLLINAMVRPEGSSTFERLTDELPWLAEGGTMPPLEWDDADGAADDVADSLRKRLALLERQFPDARSGADLVAGIITRLSAQPRVILPQGRGFELLTMLSWSMLPWRDRERLAWTQHDAANISGVTFDLANTPAVDAASIELDARAAAFAVDIVGRSSSEETWRDFQERSKSASYPLTVRDSAVITRWLDWRKGIDELAGTIDEGDAVVVASMKRLAGIARGHEDAPWIDREEVLELVRHRIADAKDKEGAVRMWGDRFPRSGLDRAIFRGAPDRRSFAHAAEDVGADLLVTFFLVAAGEDAAMAPARGALAAWVAESALVEVSGAQLAELAVRTAADGAPASIALLEHLLQSDKGLIALTARARPQAPELVFAATPIVLRHHHPHTGAFLRDVFLEHLNVVPASRVRVTAKLARDVAAALRRTPDDFVQLAARVTPEVRTELIELTTRWLWDEPKETLALGLALMQRFGGGAPEMRPLAVALANAGAPAASWFRELVEAASAIDATNDPSAASFHDTVNALARRNFKFEGATDSLVARLRQAADASTAVGECTRALIVLVRSAWRTRPVELLSLLNALLRQATVVAGWEAVIAMVAAELGKTRRTEVSDLVAVYWLRLTEMKPMPPLHLGAIEAISFLTDDDRLRVGEFWRPYIRGIPEGEAFALLVEQLYGDRTASPELRIQIAQREIDQNSAGFDTFNRLDAALYEKYGEGYGREVGYAIERYARDSDAATRIQRICNLLASDRVDQTVKRVIEVHVLQKAASRLRAADWQTVLATLTEHELLGRGVPRLMLAKAIGIAASDDTVADYEDLCRAGGYADALQFVGVSRRGRSLGRRLVQSIGFG